MKKFKMKQKQNKIECANPTNIKRNKYPKPIILKNNSFDEGTSIISVSKLLF